MSIRSQLQDKAAAMIESMAERARTPQEIEGIRQRIVAQVQSGTLKPYIGIPLVEDLTRRLTAAQQNMTQAALGAPPTQEGPPIAEQIMAQAQQPGIENLSSNLPQSYAPGGLVAFADGGEVERYQSRGLVGETPEERRRREFLATPEGRAAQIRADRVTMMTPFAGTADVAVAPFNLASAGVQGVANLVGVPRIGRALGIYGPDVTSVETPRVGGSGLSPFMDRVRAHAAGQQPAASAAAVTPFTLDPARMTAEELGPVPSSSDTDIFGGRVDQRGVASLLDATSPNAAPAAVPFFSASRVAPVNIPKTTVAQTTLAPMKAPELDDLKALVGRAPMRAKREFEIAVNKEQGILSAMNAPIEQAREAKFAARQAQNEKNAAITTALGLMSAGFGVAGSKERTLAGALGKEGREGIETLVRGEAANRAATEKLDDAQDNFEQQKLATRKGDRAGALAAGQRASDDVFKYQTMTLTAAQAGNAQALQRLAIDEGRAGTQAQLTQGVNLTQAQMNQAANLTEAQLKQAGNIANAQLAQGAAGINLQARGLENTMVFQNKQLEMLKRRYDVADAATKAKMQQVQAMAFKNFTTAMEPQLNQELAKQYGPNWRTGRDARSIEAQQIFNLRKQQFMIDSLGQSEGQRAASGARSAEDLLGAE